MTYDELVEELAKAAALAFYGNQGSYWCERFFNEERSDWRDVAEAVLRKLNELKMMKEIGKG